MTDFDSNRHPFRTTADHSDSATNASWKDIFTSKESGQVRREFCFHGNPILAVRLALTKWPGRPDFTTSRQVVFSNSTDIDQN